MSATRPHLPTVAAIGVLAFLLANVAHELVGHGGAGLLVGARPLAFSSAWYASDSEGVSIWGRRFQEAGGTLMNVLVGGLAWLAWPHVRRRSAHLAYFTWLSLAANLLPAGGYLMVSPLAGFGDWRAFVTGLEPQLAWRLGLTALGVVLSCAALALVVRAAGPLVGGGSESQRRARLRPLAWVPYLFAGALVFPLSAAFNPYGPRFVLTTLAAHLGGSAWLIWAPEWLRAAPDAPALALARHNGWLLAGALGTLFLVAVLGPGVRLTS